MPTFAGTARALRPGPLGKVLVLAALLVVALLVSRACQRSYVRITDDQAVAIGQREIDFRPEGHTIRIVLRGVPPRRFWAVSFWIRDPKGGYRKLTVVLMDANTGKVVRVTRER